MADLRIVDAPVLLQKSITDNVKIPTGGLGNYALRLGDLVWYVITKEQLANKSYVDLSSKAIKDSLDEHIADKANPHKVTKSQLGLSNVDNTSDIDKPISSAVGKALSLKADAQTVLGVDKVVSANTRLTTAKQAFPNVYVDSNGQLQKTQLVTWLDHAKMYNGLQPNGSFQMGDGTGWNLETSGLLTRDTTDSPFGAQACLRCAGGNALVLKLDKIPVNPYMKYRLSAMFKYEKVNATSCLYAGIASYDVDGNEITFTNSFHYGNTVTTLARDLKQGDTKVYLTSLSGWAYNAPGYQRGFKFYNYTDSRGYLYEPGVMSYSRYHSWSSESSLGWWDNNVASFDTANNVITLRKPWDYKNPKGQNGTWAAGTKVAQVTNSGVYQYILKAEWMVNKTGTTQWEYQAQEMEGVNTSGVDSSAMFRAGTVFIAPIFLLNYGGTTSTGDVTKVSNLYFEKI